MLRAREDAPGGSGSDLRMLERLDLVVHPGYGLNHFHRPQQELRILESIASRTKVLDPRSQAALLLMHLPPEELEAIGRGEVDDPRRMIHDAVAGIVSHLPKNTVITHARGWDVTFARLGPVFEDARGRIAQLGFTLTPETQVIVRGEMIEACVPRAAAQAARHFSLRHPVQVDLAGTNALVSRDPGQWMEGGARLAEAREANGSLKYIPIARA